LILCMSFAYAFEGDDGSIEIVGSISDGGVADDDGSTEMVVGVSSAWKEWSGSGPEMCLGPYCLNSEYEPCGNGVIDAGEVCDSGPNWADDCDDPLTDGCDWGSVVDCDSFNVTFVADQQNLGCSNTCKFDTSACIEISDNDPEDVGVCGDGFFDWNETCEFRPGSNYSDPYNMYFRDVSTCSQIDAFTGGQLKCIPPGQPDACHLDSSECYEGSDLTEMKCGYPHYAMDENGNWFNLTDVLGTDYSLACNDSYGLIPPPDSVPVPTQLCDNDMTSPDCVYAVEAHVDLGYGDNPTCYDYYTAITTPLGNNITCSGDNHWCLDGFRWRYGVEGWGDGCYEQFTICDWGWTSDTVNDCVYIDPSTGLDHSINATIGNVSECLSDFELPAEPPEWDGACCKFVTFNGVFGTYILAGKKNIKVY
jgi:hypothetical protein